MLAHAIRSLYAYNRWATARVLDAAERLTDEQWLQPGTAGRGSIRDTLVHMLSAHLGWLSWWDGTLSPEQAYRRQLEAADFPDAASVRARWERIEAQTQRFVESLQDGDMARVYAFDVPNGPQVRLDLWKMMLHVANHGTQHRSEAAAMLTAVDHSPGDLDLLFFLDPPRR